MVLGIALIISLAIILILMFSRRKTRSRVAGALNESAVGGYDEAAQGYAQAQTEGQLPIEPHGGNVRVIESGSNFRTRMSDFKSGLEELKTAVKERNEAMANLKEAGNAGKDGSYATEAGSREEGA